MTVSDDPDFRPLPMPSPANFRYEEREGVGIITLNRPDRYNALTFAVYRELTDLSMMPEGLLDYLSDEEIVDLFAYLRSLEPVLMQNAKN